MHVHSSQPFAARGVSLVEALIALLVVAFGLVTLASFGLGLSRNADVARQRSEATRLAQEKVEAWRAFEQIDTASGVAAYGDLESGADSPLLSSNTAYARSWTVTRGAGDLQRLLTVVVQWTDRAGDTANTVSLHSIISRSDPADIGSVALPTIQGTALRRTHERSLEIPFEASQLGGANRGKSALASAGSVLVFDDASGVVVARCAAPVGDATDIASTCAALSGYLLQGYIGGVPASGALSLSFDRLQYLAASSLPACTVEAATDRSTGATLASLVRYRCLIQPSDHDGNGATPPVWSGRVRFDGLAAGSAACRYTTDAGTAVNALHPETYALVTASLSQQNYVLAASGACPAGTVLQQSA